MTPRDALWEGSFNLSDLGGLPLIDGGFTADGRIFRSGRPETLTAAGWQALAADGVRTLVDLRNEDERVRWKWDPQLAPEELPEFRAIHTPTEDPFDPLFLRLCGPWLDHPQSYAENVRLYPEKFAAVFRALAHADDNILIHCVGGRDRTGMVVAMVLQLTGVETPAILDNYADAFRKASKQVADEVAIHPERHTERAYTDDEIEERIDERLPALAAWLANFTAREYLLAGGLNSGEIDAVARRLRGGIGQAKPPLSAGRPRRSTLWRRTS